MSNCDRCYIFLVNKCNAHSHWTSKVVMRINKYKWIGFKEHKKYRQSYDFPSKNLKARAPYLLSTCRHKCRSMFSLGFYMQAAFNFSLFLVIIFLYFFCFIIYSPLHYLLSSRITWLQMYSDILYFSFLQAYVILTKKRISRYSYKYMR